MAIKRCVQGCKIEHPFQDIRYGKGVRVMTKKKETDKLPQVYVCTVCSKERT